MEPSPAPRTPTQPLTPDFYDDAAASHRQILPRRRSSVAHVFGSAALRSGSLERRASMSSEAHHALAQSVTALSLPPPQPLFVFRKHEALRSSNRRTPVPVESQLSTSLTATVAYPSSGTSKAQYDKTVRKQSVMDAMTAESLAHLIIDTKRHTLDLHSVHSAVEAADAHDHANAAQQQGFTAFVEPPHPTDALWADVRCATSMSRKRDKYSRLQPRWWRHLKLRDLSDFLTPGIFSDDELLMSSSSDDGEGGHDDGPGKARGDCGRISAEVASGRSTAGEGSAGGAAKSSSLVKAAPALPSLHIAHLYASAWTQHITTRSAMHWLTPRRHGVHGGKTVAEIGTMTTVSTRDFLAMCNSLIGISQSAERVQRFTIERDEHAALALLHLQFVFKSKVLPSNADSILLVSVAETQDREDILDEQIAAVQWLLASALFIPCEMAIAAADRQRALQSYLTAAEEALKRRLIDETSVGALLSTTLQPQERAV